MTSTDWIARCTTWLVGQVDGLVNRSDKTLIGLGAIGFHELVLPTQQLPSTTVLVIVLGVLAAADAAAYYGVTPTWCTPERLCADCWELYNTKALVGFYADPENAFNEYDQAVAHRELPDGDR